MPVIDGVYPLANVREALRRFGTGDHHGKIIVSMASGEVGDVGSEDTERYRRTRRGRRIWRGGFRSPAWQRLLLAPDSGTPSFGANDDGTRPASIAAMVHDYQVTGLVIGCAIEVHKALGAGLEGRPV